MDTLTFQPIVSTAILLLIFATTAAMLWVGPSFVKLGGMRRWTLGFLRAAVLCLALVAMLRPGCVQKIEKKQSAVLLFLIDMTRSMQLPHVSDDSTRWGAVKKLIDENQSRFEKLAGKKIDVRFFGFDNRVLSLPVEEGKLQLPDSPDGSETDIGSPLYETSIDVRDQHLLGVFLLSDGVQNALDPEIEITQAADTLNDLEVPLYAVQFGLPGISEQLSDVAITSFAEQQMVNLKNDLTAKATLVSRGYTNRDITVDLLLIGNDGVEKLIQSTIYRPTSSYDETNIELVYRPTEPGEFRLKIRANPMPDELAIRNNELEAFLTVNDKGMRVLFVSGDVGWEQSFLRRSLPAADFIEMDFIAVNSDPQSRKSWPATQYERAFKDPAYDVFILADIDSTALHNSRTYTKSLQALADAVYDGKGLLMLGGYHSFGAGGYDETPLADVLPIKMRATERQNFDKEIRRDLHINSPFKLRPAKDHFLTRLGNGGSSKAVWHQLPGLVGANRISAKDNAEILLESDDDVGRPIMVASNVGGRVLAFAGDSTWRWNLKGMKPEYDQFWRQVVLWLAFWDSRNDELISIELPQRRFQPKAQVKFDVVVRTIVGESVEDATFNAHLIQPDGQQQVIAINHSGNRYVSQLDPELLSEAGLYRIHVEGFRNGAPIGQTDRDFIVMDRDKEKANPVANPEQMARLANQTKDYGGRALVPEQVSELLDEMIANPPVTKIEIPLKWRLGETFQDAAWFLFAFVGLLAIEWFLRKKWGLV